MQGSRRPLLSIPNLKTQLELPAREGKLDRIRLLADLSLHLRKSNLMLRRLVSAPVMRVAVQLTDTANARYAQRVGVNVVAIPSCRPPVPSLVVHCTGKIP